MGIAHGLLYFELFSVIKNSLAAAEIAEDTGLFTGER